MAENVIGVEILRLPHGLNLPLPDYLSAYAAAMDVCAAVSDAVVVKPSAIILIPTGFAIALPRGFEAQLRPRSGIATKQRVLVPNSPGTIDADYRGEVFVPLLNLGTDDFRIERGMRVAQMVITPIWRVDWREVSELTPTARGAGGFGHTGI
jgi:dUTP pyrophosphatase